MTARAGFITLALGREGDFIHGQAPDAGACGGAAAALRISVDKRLQQGGAPILAGARHKGRRSGSAWEASPGRLPRMQGLAALQSGIWRRNYRKIMPGAPLN